MAFFHAMVNGCRWKCLISRLTSDSAVILELRALQEHIYTFYRDLMGSAGETKAFSLAPSL
jgi:hypothetical protein